MRILFANEGDLGGIMGHAAIEETFRAALAGLDGVEARFVSLPRLTGVARLFTRSVPPLSRADLDLQAARWQVVQSRRTAGTVRRELAAFPADALVVDSHAVALALGREMRRVPTFLSVDATVWDFRAMAVWRPVRRWSRAALGPSIALERRAFRLAAGVFAHTEWSRRSVERVCPEARVVACNPGVDLRLFRPAERGPRERLRVLLVGSNFGMKGGFDLLEALGPRVGRDVEVDLVTRTEVPEREGVRVHSLTVRDPRLVELYQQADVFCLPTYADIAPFAVMEAMACGAAVVTTTVPGNDELLEDGRAGELVPAGDVASLRGALDRVLADERYRAELGARARARCEERYDADRQARALVEWIAATAAERRR